MTTYVQYYMESVLGTPYWMAPEYFYGHYTEKADVFSLGVLFFRSWSEISSSVIGKRFTVHSRWFLVQEKLALDMQWQNTMQPSLLSSQAKLKGLVINKG